MIDVSGLVALRLIIEKYQRAGTAVILSGVQSQPGDILKRLYGPGLAQIHFAPDFPQALIEAQRLLAAPPTP